MNTLQLLQGHRAAIERELKAVVGESPSPLRDMMRYHLGWVNERGQAVLLPGGKLLRPLLCLLSCQAVGGDYRRALPAAVAIELLHNFSLIHDDIQDRGQQRRHRPTVWWLWGEAQAITAGDSMHVLSHLVLPRLRKARGSADTTLEAIRVLDEASLSLCEGQYLDLSFEGMSEVGTAAYLDMISKKTAALFAAAARIGALLGTNRGEKVSGLASFGEKLGMAFQIQDDILGTWGRQETTGKPSLSDIRGRKKSLPVVHALATAQGQELERLQGIFRQAEIGSQDAASVLATLEKLGSRSYCQALAQSYYEEALAQLEALSLDDVASEALRELAVELVAREA